MSKLTYDDFKERFEVAVALLQVEAPVTEDDVKKAFATLAVFSAWNDEENRKARREWKKQQREDREAWDKKRNIPAVDKNNI